MRCEAGHSLLKDNVCNEKDRNLISPVVGGLGAMPFFALSKVDFVSEFCVPCNVLKIASDSITKVSLV